MTKVGAGDKERAYVVRQNIFLKTIVAVMAALVLLGTTLCCTIYKVDLQRRTSLKDAREHREEEAAVSLAYKACMLKQQEASRYGGKGYIP